MPTYRVLLTDYAWPDLEIETRLLNDAGAELVVDEDVSPTRLAELARDVDAIMTNWAKVPAEVIKAAPKCRIISRLGIGLDNIDVDCATQRGIIVTNVPDYCLIEVAEHSLALLLALARKVAFFHAQTKSGRYDLQSGPILRRIAGQTLGIVGLGAIGRHLAKLAMGIGLRVIAINRSGTSPMDDVQITDLPSLLRESDYISLHVPLTDATRDLIGSDELATMKSTSYLINTARGGVIDHTALAEALAAGQLAGAALDVQPHEPPNLSQPPYNDPRVIVTPHAAFYSEESVSELRQRCATQVVSCLTGKVPMHIVNGVETTR